MELTRFIFWTAMKALSLAFLGLLAVKAVAAMQSPARGPRSGRIAILRGFLYAVVIALVTLSARTIGYDVAAEIYARASSNDLAEGRTGRAYANALRAVEMRPGVLRYWRALALAKLGLRQFHSLVQDLPAFQALSGGALAEEDNYCMAAGYYFQARYDMVTPLTQQMIRQNPMYAAPYILQGYAYTAQKRFAEAERTFLDVLRIFPTQHLAVEGLAHLYFLGGNKEGALDILDQTAKFPFPPESRQRFEALKALYAQ